MSSSPYRIAVAGLGTVGIGLLALLEQNRELIGARAGRQIEVIGVNAMNRSKDRGMDLSSYLWVDDTMDLPDLPDLDAVVELIGGDSGPALALARKTLNAGLDFITANKALLAIHGVELAELAEKNKASIAYEAAVAGAIPVIKALREGLAGNEISKIGGILNGTCNYILSEMEETGGAYQDILKDAQDLGYAEADPTTDVGGFDAAHKLTLLSAVAFGHKPDFDACSVSGINMISGKALAYADRLGYRLRLIGFAEKTVSGCTQTVQTMAVPKNSPLGLVTGSYNAVQIFGDQSDDIFLRGRGAGRAQTASAVSGDIIDLATGLKRPVFGKPLAEMGESQGNRPGGSPQSFLCILTVKDEPGVMAHITQTLAASQVSVDQLLQPGGKDGLADLVFVTHAAEEQNLTAAFANLQDDAAILTPIETYRIERFGQ